MNESPESSSPAIRLWAGVVLAAALVIGVTGAVRNFEGPPTGPAPESIGLPEPIEPPEGKLPEPPRVFRWTPGSDHFEWAQVILYRGSLERIWESPPVRGTEVELDPAVAYRGVPAGEACYWKVREVGGGRALGTSRIAEFIPLTDYRGLGPGAPTDAPFVRD